MFTYVNYLTNKDSQVTDRFTKAIDQLGNKKTEIRLGGIYALERISKESNKDYWAIMNILAAYVRNNSFKNEDNAEQENVLLEVQEILNVIRRRKYIYTGEFNVLDLHSTHLRKADLKNVDFYGANLEEANLGEAHLENADLRKASLENANLNKAHLDFAKLQGANLCWANLKEADLEGTHFGKADLRRACLEGADLKGTHFEETNLEGANLLGAKNLFPEQLLSAKTLYFTELDSELISKIYDVRSSLFDNPDEQN